eukprot:scaffold178103_cov45-Prasinocladus_malaysianus.AAC.1
MSMIVSTTSKPWVDTTITTYNGKVYHLLLEAGPLGVKCELPDVLSEDVVAEDDGKLDPFGRHLQQLRQVLHVRPIQVLQAGKRDTSSHGTDLF